MNGEKRDRRIVVVDAREEGGTLHVRCINPSGAFECFVIPSYMEWDFRNMSPEDFMKILIKREISNNRKALNMKTFFYVEVPCTDKTKVEMEMQLKITAANILKDGVSATLEKINETVEQFDENDLELMEEFCNV